MSLPETAVEVDGRVGAVVVGLDRGLNYYKLQVHARCTIAAAFDHYNY